MMEATSFPPRPYFGARPVWASLRAVRPLPPFSDNILMLNLVVHEHRPDTDGFFPQGAAVLLEREVRFIWHRGEVYNELPFWVPFAPGEKLLPFMSASLSDGTVVAVGGVRPAPGGQFSDRNVQVAAAAIVLATERSH
ncbi:hypothetical protein [Brevundimonas sp. TWP2-3-2]|uniref:hypothetical protein n=1 Tax=unclassified Brevundimonas TaxID=2622653 RepID=UPI003CEFAA57